MAYTTAVSLASGLESTGGGGDQAAGRDSGPRRCLAYMMVAVCLRTARASVRVLPREQPFRVLIESIVDSTLNVLERMPLFGLVPTQDAPAGRTTRRLWFVAGALLLTVVLSDLLAVGPIDLGLIPDVHVFAHASPWVGDAPHAHFFTIDLPWQTLW